MGRNVARQRGLTKMACVAVTVFGVIGQTSGSFAAQEQDCVIAAQAAALQTDVPLPVLLAVALTESGRGSGAGTVPWPWALNQAGQSHWFASRSALLAHLERLEPAALERLDIGCFQLNHHWHRSGFTSVFQMVDPDLNALYAARHLAELYRRHQDWTAAVAAFHSQSPEHAAAYLARFLPIYARLTAADMPAAPVPLTYVNHYPLLRAGDGAALGSLVAARQDARPLIGD